MKLTPLFNVIQYVFIVGEETRSGFFNFSVMILRFIHGVFIYE